jgi:hypothetical protein
MMNAQSRGNLSGGESTESGRKTRTAKLVDARIVAEDGDAWWLHGFLQSPVRVGGIPERVNAIVVNRVIRCQIVAECRSSGTRDCEDACGD